MWGLPILVHIPILEHLKDSSMEVMAITPEDWQRIVEYILDTPVMPARAGKAVEILPLLGKATKIKIDLEKDE